MLGTAARRLFFSVRPSTPANSSRPLVPRRRLCCASLPSAVRRKGKGKEKLAPQPAAAEDDHRRHLKRRTRSGAAFDRELYSRYEGGGHHAPVMLGEVLQAFRASRLRSFTDYTLGSAGHSAAIIDAHGEMELFIGLDVDPSAYDLARPRIDALLSSNPRLSAYTHVRNFKYIRSVLAGVGENLLNCGIDGILMDLGMSSMQVNHSERGFSVLADGPLDMRMDPQQVVIANRLKQLKFVYLDKGMYLRFGSDIKMQGRFQRTPIIMNEKLRGYYLNILDVSFNGKRLDLNHTWFVLNEEGKHGCYIDSGSEITDLYVPAFKHIQEEATEYFKHYNFSPVMYKRFRCFRMRKDFPDLPTLTLHFSGAESSSAKRKPFLLCR